jgi:hypothetical protein
MIKDLSHDQIVEFALFCANDVFHLNNEKTKGSASNCIELSKKWLKDHSSVKNEELIFAASDSALFSFKVAFFDRPASFAVATAYNVVAAALNEDKYLDFINCVLRDASEAVALSVSKITCCSGYQSAKSSALKKYHEFLKGQMKKCQLN